METATPRGVWIVYTLTDYYREPLVLSVWDSEILARRAADVDLVERVAFAPFGANIKQLLT